VNLSLPKVTGNVLGVDGIHEHDTIRVRFTGTADVEAKPDLDNVVKSLHQEVLRLATKQGVIDFRELEFMNSSSFKVFVAWLASVQDLPADQQYRIQFLSNPNMHWQRRSLAALSCFAVDLVTIET
jgi:hypothetical protein